MWSCVKNASTSSGGQHLTYHPILAKVSALDAVQKVHFNFVSQSVFQITAILNCGSEVMLSNKFWK